MTFPIVPSRDLERAVQLLAKDVIIYSRTENWLVIHHSQADELLRKLLENGITISSSSLSEAIRVAISLSCAIIYSRPPDR